MAKIRHLAIISEDPEKLAEFYVDIYGMEITGRSNGDVWVTDGYMDVALIHQQNVKKPKGLFHFGFTLDPAEKPAVYEKMKKRGLEPFNPRADNPDLDRPFVEDAAFDIDGNRFDLSLGKRDMEEEKKLRLSSQDGKR
jgi:catechol 2,3-dioxygenase-like lactoylglutathione lyase family enzyme